jgi:hypothetical protein
MTHLLNSSFGTTYRTHITQIGMGRNVQMLGTVDEVAISRFLTWKTNSSYEIEQLRGRAHCDP